MNTWSAHSRAQIETLHPDLKILCSHVLDVWDIKVYQGFRPQEDQDLAFFLGNTKVQWPNSRHNILPSEGVDLYPYVEGRFIGWTGDDAMEHWFCFGGLVLGIASALYEQGVIQRRILWGGDWDSDWNFREQKFDDLPHFELYRP